MYKKMTMCINVVSLSSSWDCCILKNDHICKCVIPDVIMGLWWVNDGVCRCGIPIVTMELLCIKK